jgi:hypothetical protein
MPKIELLRDMNGSGHLKFGTAFVADAVKNSSIAAAHR